MNIGRAPKGKYLSLNHHLFRGYVSFSAGMFFTFHLLFAKDVHVWLCFQFGLKPPVFCCISAPGCSEKRAAYNGSLASNWRLLAGYSLAWCVRLSGPWAHLHLFTSRGGDRRTSKPSTVHPGRLNRNLQITHFQRKMIGTKPPWLCSMLIFREGMIFQLSQKECQVGKHKAVHPDSCLHCCGSGVCFCPPKNDTQIIRLPVLHSLRGVLCFNSKKEWN